MAGILRYCVARLIAVAGAIAAGTVPAAHEVPPPLPQRLSETALYDGAPANIRPENLAYSPQYALWSDGAVKRRWLFIPAGSWIDAADPDHWVFPVGTRLWKQFGYERPVETRLIERLADGSWRFAVYAWEPDGLDAVLAPAQGLAPRPVAAAPGGSYEILSRDDCRACHEGTRTPVLGLSALQLSADRDPGARPVEIPATNEIGMRFLLDEGLLRNLPQELIAVPPRINASTATARSALGYLHANCGHCHNSAGPLAEMQLALEQRVGDAQTLGVAQRLAGQPSEFRLPGVDHRLVPGRPELSMIALRMRSRDPLVQMPPLGTHAVDAAGVALIDDWILGLTLQLQESHR